MDYDGLLRDLNDMAFRAIAASLGANGFFVSREQEDKAVEFAAEVDEFRDEILRRVN